MPSPPMPPRPAAQDLAAGSPSRSAAEPRAAPALDVAKAEAEAEPGGFRARTSQTASDGTTSERSPKSKVSGAAHKRSIRSLHSSVNVNVEEGRVEVEGDAVKELEKATFKDVRWDNALKHIRQTDAWDRTVVKQLVRKGAKAFGFWHLSDDIVECLAGHVIGEQAQVSGALQAWMGQEDTCERRSKAAERVSALVTAGQKTLNNQHEGKRGSRAPNLFKAVMCLITLIISNVYALDVVLNKYPTIMTFFSWKIYVARACGMGALVWTAFLFLTMARTLQRALLARLPIGSKLLDLANAHKELHVFCGKMLACTAGLHVLAHLLGTLPGIVAHTKDELNTLLGCANPDSTPGYLGVHMPWLVWPQCPLKREFTYLEVLFMSTVGVSGIFLVVVISLVGYTSRKKARSAQFDRFWYIHNTAMVLWPCLLFLHGSNSWVGVGCPLVFFVVAPPLLCYAADRALRLLRFYFFAGKAVTIQEAVIRPGRNGSSSGALTYLMISRPPFLWCDRFKAGMYAFICMPEYAPAQWHPFSICSGPEDETLQFIIQGVGDWTQELARRCLEMQKPPEEGSLMTKFPTIAVDGPYLAPTVSALSREVLVAVGAGVGVTPFLSLLSAIITGLTRESESIPLREAHFYWMTRSADELLFGRQLFTKIASHPQLRDKVFLHLHVTHKAPDGDVATFLFREAVKRQSALDRRTFEAATPVLAKKDLNDISAAAPWNWLHRAKDDLLWVSSLVETPDADVSAEISAAHNDHWSAGALRNTKALDEEEAAAVTPGSACARRFRMKAKTGTQSVTKGLFTGSLSRDLSGFSIAVPVGPTGYGTFLPVAFGRPDFKSEVRAVGKAHPGQDIHIYVCGNKQLVNSLHQVCDDCSERSASQDVTPQTYECHFERFG